VKPTEKSGIHFFMVFVNFDNESHARLAANQTNGISFLSWRITTKMQMEKDKSMVSQTREVQPQMMNRIEDTIVKEALQVSNTQSIILAKHWKQFEDKYSVKFATDSSQHGQWTVRGLRSDCTLFQSGFFKMFTKSRYEKSTHEYYEKIVDEIIEYSFSSDLENYLQNEITKMSQREFCWAKIHDNDTIIAVGSQQFHDYLAELISPPKVTNTSLTSVVQTPFKKDIYIVNGCVRHEIRKSIISYVKTLQENFQCKLFVHPVSETGVLQVSISIFNQDHLVHLENLLKSYLTIQNIVLQKAEIEYLYEVRERLFNVIHCLSVACHITFKMKENTITLTCPVEISQIVCIEISDFLQNRPITKVINFQRDRFPLYSSCFEESPLEWKETEMRDDHVSIEVIGTERNLQVLRGKLKEIESKWKSKEEIHRLTSRQHANFVLLCISLLKFPKVSIQPTILEKSKKISLNVRIEYINDEDLLMAESQIDDLLDCIVLDELSLEQFADDQIAEFAKVLDSLYPDKLIEIDLHTKKVYFAEKSPETLLILKESLLTKMQGEVTLLTKKTTSFFTLISQAMHRKHSVTWKGNEMKITVSNKNMNRDLDSITKESTFLLIDELKKCESLEMEFPMGFDEICRSNNIQCSFSNALVIFSPGLLCCKQFSNLKLRILVCDIENSQDQGVLIKKGRKGEFVDKICQLAIEYSDINNLLQILHKLDREEVTRISIDGVESINAIRQTTFKCIKCISIWCTEYPQAEKLCDEITEKQKVEVQANWFWKEKGQFTPYEKSISQTMEYHYKKDKSLPLNIKIQDTSYAIEFQNMNQTNIKTNHSRTIRREEVKMTDNTPKLVPLPTVLCEIISSDAAVIDKAKNLLIQTNLLHLVKQEFKEDLLNEEMKALTEKYHLTLEKTQQGVKLVGYQTQIDLYQRDLLKILLSKPMSSVQQMIQYPKDWKADQEIQIVKLDAGSPKFQEIEAEIHKTHNCRVISIDRVENKSIWKQFFMNRQLMENQTTKFLFHGTRSTPPEKVYTGSVGFDMRYCPSGMWGRAIYFAVNASYSCQNYASTTHNGYNQAFYAEVCVGDYIQLSSSSDLKHPPEKIVGAITREYDSVMGRTNGSDVFMLYKNLFSYPSYLITFQNY
jgi:hypothetical protein